MNMKLWMVPAIMFLFTMFACSDNNVTGSSDDSNVITAEKMQSSSFDSELSSSMAETFESSSSVEPSSSSSGWEHVLCKTTGSWRNSGCLVKYELYGDLWSYGGAKVKTDAYAEDSSKFGERAGEFFFEKDSADNGRLEMLWSKGELVTEFGGFPEGSGWFNDTCDSFVNVGFYTAGFDSNGAVLSADISNWNGICVLYGGSVAATLQLDLGDSINQELGYALPSVVLKSYEFSQCFKWNDFMSSVADKEKVIIWGEDAAKHVERIVFQFHVQSSEKLFGFGIYAIGTNRDE